MSNSKKENENDCLVYKSMTRSDSSVENELGSSTNPKKRSKWDQEGGHDDDLEAKAKEAAIEARKRLKEVHHYHNVQPSFKLNASAVPDRQSYPIIQGCRSVDCYERLNHIEEGSYGIVFRAREKETGEIVALKKLKMDKEKNGFPITSLREIRTLMESKHENIVNIREIVVGETLTKIFIVMDFIEHDLKTLLSQQNKPFSNSEIKTILHQLLSATALMHQNWIIHRDLKTSNLLFNNRGQIKIADFGLARMYGDPPMQENEMTSMVVTLWYRAPELLLGIREYDTAIDIWSIGCIFAELMNGEPLFCGKNETDQISQIFRLLGQPSEEIWPGLNKLLKSQSGSQNEQQIRSTILLQKAKNPLGSLREKFRFSGKACLDLLQKMLTYDPKQRITAQQALRHPYFTEPPAPAHPDTFGSFPSIAAGERKQKIQTPNAPSRKVDEKTTTSYPLELDLP